jgi:peptidoglycan hydrolase CwlO-like protein
VLQLAEAATMLQQLQSEQEELTRVLIDAKVEIAEKKGEQQLMHGCKTTAQQVVALWLHD